MDDRAKARGLGRLWPFVPALAYMVLIFWVSSLSMTQARLPRHSDKLIHFAEYGVLAALWIFALRGRSPRAALWALVIASLYGASDEIHQLFVPLRSASVYDWVADTLGAGIVAAAVVLARRTKTKE